MAASQLQGLFSTVVYEYSPNPSQLQGLFSTVVYEYSPNPSQLQGLFATTVYDADPNVSDITGSTAATASFVAAVGGLEQSIWTWTSIPGGSSIANSQIAFPDNKATTPINMSGNVGLYHFEGNANDSSGEGTNGTVSNATQVTGRVGSNAYHFNSNSSTYITLGAASDYAFTSGDFSIAFWVNPHSSQDSYAPLFSKLGNGGWGSNSRGYWIDQNASTANRYRWGIRHGTSNTYGSNFDLTHSVWSHVVATKESGTYKVYVNGSQVTSDSMNDTINQTDNDSALVLGRHGLGYTGNIEFSGSIDEFAIWSRALSSVDIKDIYLAQSGSVAGTGNTLSFVPDVIGTYTVKFETGLISGSADAVISAVVSGPDGISKIINISKDSIGSILGITYGDIDKINDID